MWLTQAEVAGAVNVSATALALAQQCANTTCTPSAEMRMSRTVTKTSWGGGEMSFS